MDRENQCQFCQGTGQCVRCHGSGVDTDDPDPEEECVASEPVQSDSIATTNQEDADVSEVWDCRECDGTGKCKECRGSGNRASWLRELWEAFDSLDHYLQRLVLAGVVALGFMTTVLWRLTLPFIAVIIGIAIYLRRSRSKDSL
jgi:hypothetical protein